MYTAVAHHRLIGSASAYVINVCNVFNRSRDFLSYTGVCLCPTQTSAQDVHDQQFNMLRLKATCLLSVYLSLTAVCVLPLDLKNSDWKILERPQSVTSCPTFDLLALHNHGDRRPSFSSHFCRKVSLAAEC